MAQWAGGLIFQKLLMFLPNADLRGQCRVGVIGQAAFFGDEVDKNIGLDWFIGKAWICALSAADGGDMGSCTTLLSAYVSHLRYHPAAGTKHAQASFGELGGRVAERPVGRPQVSLWTSGLPVP